ncbi:MAG: MerR family transcriptional regulator [Crocinitomicaceae bacterium]|nr:MerR family transcriptional regulator [Crocinitomicaceae bacterium]
MTNGQGKDLEKLLASGKQLAAEYPGIFKEINEPRYSIGDIGLNSRILNYWEKKGLFLKEHDPRKRKKFDLVDSVWMKMIQKLRQFDISLVAINNIKNLLVSRPEINESNKDAIEKVVLDLCSEDDRDAARLFVQSKEFSTMMEKIELNLLQVVVMDVILLRNQYSLLINAEGELMPFKINELEFLMQQEEWRKLFSNSHVSISVNELLEGLVDELGEVEASNVKILSEDEMKVLNALKEDGVKTVEINISQDGSRKAEKITLTKSEVIDDSKRMSELMLRNKYEDITVKSENGKIVYCERKEKRKLN